ncbi:MAG: hypothetical protein JNL42_12750 [Anaerolineae bacterium]|nr:hypothetical protein [Anaerolineae bacterium]
MFAPVEMLWWLSQEYGQRLARANRYLELLERLLTERIPPQSSDSLLHSLAESRGFLETLHDEYRDWRYSYFYQTPDTRRMVSAEADVQRAVERFRRMRARHLEMLITFGGYFEDLPRPEGMITHVPNGDLWEMVREALAALIDFDRDEVSG